MRRLRPRIPRRRERVFPGPMSRRRRAPTRSPRPRPRARRPVRVVLVQAHGERGETDDRSPLRMAATARAQADRRQRPCEVAGVIGGASQPPAAMERPASSCIIGRIGVKAKRRRRSPRRGRRVRQWKRREIAYRQSSRLRFNKSDNKEQAVLIRRTWTRATLGISTSLAMAGRPRLYCSMRFRTRGPPAASPGAPSRSARIRAARAQSIAVYGAPRLSERNVNAMLASRNAAVSSVTVARLSR